jgi:hypothetical protein
MQKQVAESMDKMKRKLKTANQKVVEVVEAEEAELVPDVEEVDEVPTETPSEAPEGNELAIKRLTAMGYTEISGNPDLDFDEFADANGLDVEVIDMFIAKGLYSPLGEDGKRNALDIAKLFAFFKGLNLNKGQAKTAMEAVEKKSESLQELCEIYDEVEITLFYQRLREVLAEK